MASLRVKQNTTATPIATRLQGAGPAEGDSGLVAAQRAGLGVRCRSSVAELSSERQNGCLPDVFEEVKGA